MNKLISALQETTPYELTELVSAVEALYLGNTAEAKEALASYLVIQTALNTVLNWTSHPENVTCNSDLVVTEDTITGSVNYRNEVYSITVDL